ncbi:DUF4265 domain-containing protein [Streptomyces xantholiticus]|uniref:DUF4265 domain-containing protein n=1 Tax=Streptomyces xantholiticus TaxID=68285 RepID=UPI0019B09E9C|nr:DUF4265 domain-containing protein [Streptomyces xantholiticus]GGW71353.1 hypothetical protein GCM10010381_65090 [Streptomyces xantholiticus]
MPEGEVNDRVRVVFQLEQNDGWPPVASERLWAIPVDVDLVRIDNVPWFVRDLALNDIVRTRTDARGAFAAVGKVSWSGNCTVRIIPYGSGRFAGDPQGVVDIFSPLGVHAEAIEKFGMIALSVPPSADIPGVKGLLIQGSEADWWDYEESCIGNVWVGANPR